MQSGEKDMTEADGMEDVREHEAEGRRQATAAESQRGEQEREREMPRGERPDAEQGGGLADESDEERRGVMRPPEGAGPDA